MSAVPSLALVRHHLGWPAGVDLGGEIDARVDLVTRWYGEHGNPWTRSSRVAVDAIEGDVVRLAGAHQIQSALIADGFRRADVVEVVVLAASAGAEIDAEVRRHWSEDRPDDAMFLGAVGSAVAEHLRAVGEKGASDAARADGLVALPGYSPGFHGWALTDQRELFSILAGAVSPLPGPLEVLESGGLDPSKSTLTAIGLTRRRVRTAHQGSSRDAAPQQESGEPSGPCIDLDPRTFWAPCSRARDGVVYSFPEKALRRWSRQRLEWLPAPGGRCVARFRFDGTTCSNMGLDIAMSYDVSLEQRQGGAAVIVACDCSPREGDRGLESMCAYRADPDGFAARLAELPFEIGATLEETLGPRHSRVCSGCLCRGPEREHKWRIVLETIHFDLFGQEDGGPR